MIVDKLIKNTDTSYTVIVGEESYEFNEETILRYRLVQGKEITRETLLRAKLENQTADYYGKALIYALRYGKSQAAVYDYLRAKGLPDTEIENIIERLKDVKAIRDETLILSLTDTLSRKGNGRLLIERKLTEQKFPEALISKALQGMDSEEYYRGMRQAYEKAKRRYNDEPLRKKIKIQKYLLSRGYTFDDIGKLDMEDND